MIPLIIEHSSGEVGSSTTLYINHRTFYQSYSNRAGRATCYELDALGEAIESTRKSYPVTNFSPSAGVTMRKFVEESGEAWPESVVDQ